MALTENSKVFIHRDLLLSENGVDKLREFFSSEKEIPNNLIIGSLEGGLNITPPTPAQQQLSNMSDEAIVSFNYFVAQKMIDGYIYATVQSFKRMLGV